MHLRYGCSAAVSGIAVLLALSGPLVSFYGLTVWWTVATVLLTTAAIVCLILASWTDPGYLPQYSDRDPLIDILVEAVRPALRETRSLRVSVEYQGDTYHKFLQDGSWVRDEPGARRSCPGHGSNRHSPEPCTKCASSCAPSHETVAIMFLAVSHREACAGIRRGHRYCHACNIWRPPHAHHCQHCQRCVGHFDHHCDVLHTCVGGLNHRWFTTFLLSAFFASLTLCGGGVRTILLLGFLNGVAFLTP